MGLRDAFNDVTLRREGATALTVYYNTYPGTVYTTYDFLQRVTVTRTGESKGGASVTPFSQLDREVLETMREKLLELGGKPPELAGNTKPALPTGNKPLNL